MIENTIQTKIPRKYNYTKKPGRPLKTLTDLPSNWKQIVFEEAAKGASEVEIRGALILLGGMNVKTIETLWWKLKDREPEFQQTYLMCKVLCEKWWCEKARKSLKTMGFQGYTWFKNMQNRFGWKERSDIEHSLSESTVEKFANLQISELRKKANEILNRGTTRISTN